MSMEYVRDLTGEVTASVGAAKTDLGILRHDPDRGCLVAMYGDTEPWSNDWRSPVVICYDKDYNVLGIPDLLDDGTPVISPAKPVRQLWHYIHRNPRFDTVLPADFIRIGLWWYVAVIVTKELGNEQWVEFQKSRDLVRWEHTGKYIWPQEHSNQMMLTFDTFGEWVYICATGGLRRTMPVWMWRVLVDEFPHGRWVVANVAGELPILDEPSGELCLRNCGGHAVLTRFVNQHGAWRVEVRVLDEPGKEWKTASTQIVADHHQFPQLYGGYLSPYSRLDQPGGAWWAVSQWDTVSGDNDPYCARLIRGTLNTPGTPERLKP